MNETIICSMYHNDVPRFLAFSRGFIECVLFDYELNMVSMTLSVDIPWAHNFIT